MDGIAMGRFACIYNLNLMFTIWRDEAKVAHACPSSAAVIRKAHMMEDCFWPAEGCRTRRLRQRGHAHFATEQPSGLNTRVVDAGNFASFAAGRRGRGSNSPPQFGQIPARRCSVQSLQNVHSKVQIRAEVESGGKSRSQHSHPGRI